MSNARIILKNLFNKRLVILVDNLNTFYNLNVGQQINIQNANNNRIAVNIIEINNRSTTVESTYGSDDLRYFNQNDRITFNPPPDGGFKSKKRSKSKKVSKSKNKKVSKSKNKKVSKSKKVSKY